MAGETLVTVVGNLTADEELRYTNSGIPVAGEVQSPTARHWGRREPPRWHGGGHHPVSDAASDGAVRAARGGDPLVAGAVDQGGYHVLETAGTSCAPDDRSGLGMMAAHKVADRTGSKG
jgi:hypothetical protein